MKLSMVGDKTISCSELSSVSSIVLPSIGNIIFVSVLFVLAFSSGQGLLGDGDTGYHIRTGEIILQNWKVPTEDPYSFHYPPLKWTAHEWLSEVIMAAIYRTTGLSGVVLFFALVLATTHWLLFQILRNQLNDIFLCATVTLLATSASSTHWLARPHAFSLLFALIWCTCLDRFQYRHQKTLAYLPLLMIVWVNLHGGFMIGLIFLVIYFMGNIFYALIRTGTNRAQHIRKAKSLGLVLLATLLACLINPYGWEILLFPIRVMSDRFIMDRVTEFLSPNFHEVLPFKYMLLITIGALALSRTSLNVIEVSLLLLLSYMALYSARHVSLFAIVVAPILLRTLKTILHEFPNRLLQFYQKRVDNLSSIDGSVKGLLWPVVGASLIVLLALLRNLEYGFSPEKFPVAATEFLKKERISGNMFNNDEFGDYLIFAARDYRVFMDGRSDMYGEKFGNDYLRVANTLPGWKAILERYHITWVIFDSESPLTAALQEEKDWQAIYTDRVATVFVKKILAHASLLQKYSRERDSHLMWHQQQQTGPATSDNNRQLGLRMYGKV